MLIDANASCYVVCQLEMTTIVDDDGEDLSFETLNPVYYLKTGTYESITAEFNDFLATQKGGQFVCLPVYEGTKK